MSDTLPVDENGLEYLEFDGHRRYFGKLRPDAGMLGSFPSFGASMPLVPRSDWVEIDRRELFGTDITEDQNGYNCCSAEAGTTALAKSCVLQGREYVRLSPALPYSLANGGRDAGSMIANILRALQDKGTCEFSTHGRTPFYRNQIPSTAWEQGKRWRVAEAYNADSFNEIASGIQRGFMAVYGIQVGKNFGSLSASGIAPYVRGPGNHAMSADGMKQIGGKWYLDNHNSWGNRYGQNGRCYLGEEHFRGIDPDCWLIRAAEEDPDNAPPPMA